MKTDPEKIKIIKEWKEPKNIKQIQQFLGLCGYYRKFIQDFSKIARSLYNLLKKEKKWIWTKECQDAFEELKEKLINHPILGIVDFTKEFKLYTDASGYALGAILAQIGKDDKEHVLQYASRLLKGAEINYGITEKECLAVIWAIKHFSCYLRGVKFQIITDHSPLLWIRKISNPTGRLARWIMLLLEYSFEMYFKNGKKHTNVDMLSRPILLTNIQLYQNDNDIDEEMFIDHYENDNLIEYLTKGKFLPGKSKKKCKRDIRLADKLIKEGEYLYYFDENNKVYIKIPKITKIEN